MASTQESSAFHWHYSQLDDRNFEIGGRTLFFVILLFAIIITATLLFLYARLVCRSTNLLPISHPHAPDPAVLTKLPITLHLPASGETECCICLGIIGEGEKVKVLPHCRHCYHSDCLDRWLFTHSTCPLCRVPLRVDSSE